jgi:hypothetical protein
MGASMISCTMSRIEVSSPPGVSSRMIASGASSSAASESAEPIHFSVAGSIVPVSSIEGTVSELCAPTVPGSSKSPASSAQSQTCTRERMGELSATGYCA